MRSEERWFQNGRVRTPSTESLSDGELAALQGGVDRLLRDWTYSSLSAESTVIKVAAHREFDLPGLIYNPNRHPFPLRDVERARQLLRYLYERTQAALAHGEGSPIELFRGVGTQRYTPTGLQSWTRDVEVAYRFDGFAVFKENVAKTQVLAFSGGPLWPSALVRESKYILMVG